MISSYDPAVIGGQMKLDIDAAGGKIGRALREAVLDTLAEEAGGSAKVSVVQTFSGAEINVTFQPGVSKDVVESVKSALIRIGAVKAGSALSGQNIPRELKTLLASKGIV